MNEEDDACETCAHGDSCSRICFYDPGTADIDISIVFPLGNFFRDDGICIRWEKKDE